jgi:hypothetical protein
MNGTSSRGTIERCEREVEACRRAGENPTLTPKQKLGAILGEVDWLVALQIAMEDRVSRKGESDEADVQTTTAVVPEIRTGTGI